MMAVVTITKENFKQEVLDAKEVVLVDFWASWCGPCKMMLPVVDQIAEEGIENLKVCKINIDEEPDLAEQYRVMTIPTFMVVKNGEKQGSVIGVQPKAALMQMVEKAR